MFCQKKRKNNRFKTKLAANEQIIKWKNKRPQQAVYCKDHDSWHVVYTSKISFVKNKGQRKPPKQKVSVVVDRWFEFDEDSIDGKIISRARVS